MKWRDQEDGKNLNTKGLYQDKTIRNPRSTVRYETASVELSSRNNDDNSRSEIRRSDMEARGQVIVRLPRSAELLEVLGVSEGLKETTNVGGELFAIPDCPRSVCSSMLDSRNAKKSENSDTVGGINEKIRQTKRPAGMGADRGDLFRPQNDSRTGARAGRDSIIVIDNTGRVGENEGQRDSERVKTWDSDRALTFNLIKSLPWRLERICFEGLSDVSVAVGERLRMICIDTEGAESWTFRLGADSAKSSSSQIVKKFQNSNIKHELTKILVQYLNGSGWLDLYKLSKLNLTINVVEQHKNEMNHKDQTRYRRNTNMILGRNIDHPAKYHHHEISMQPSQRKSQPDRKSSSILLLILVHLNFNFQLHKDIRCAKRLKCFDLVISGFLAEPYDIINDDAYELGETLTRPDDNGDTEPDREAHNDGASRNKEGSDPPSDLYGSSVRAKIDGGVSKLLLKVARSGGNMSQEGCALNAFLIATYKSGSDDLFPSEVASWDSFIFTLSELLGTGGSSSTKRVTNSGSSQVSLELVEVDTRNTSSGLEPNTTTTPSLERNIQDFTAIQRDKIPTRNLPHSGRLSSWESLALVTLEPDSSFPTRRIKREVKIESSSSVNQNDSNMDHSQARQTVRAAKFESQDKNKTNDTFNINSNISQTAAAIPPISLPSYRSKKSGCALYDHKSYVIYSALGSFYIPMLIMVFFYSRIYLVASRAQKNLQRGYMTTKCPLGSAKGRFESAASGASGGPNGAHSGSGDHCSSNGPSFEQVTLRIHRRRLSTEATAREVSSHQTTASTTRTSSSELLKLAGERASQQLATNLNRANCQRIVEPQKRIRRQSAIANEDREDVFSYPSVNRDANSLDKSGQDEERCEQTSADAGELQSISLDHPTELGSDFNESRTTLTSNSCLADVDSPGSLPGGRYRRHAHPQHHQHRHHNVQRRRHHRHHQHHQHHHHHHHHHHHGTRSGECHSPRCSRSSGENTPIAKESTETATAKETNGAVHEFRAHSHRHAHRRHRHHRQKSSRSGWLEKCHSLGGGDSTQASSSLRLSVDQVKLSGNYNCIAEETRAGSSSSRTSIFEGEQRQVQITLSLVDGPESASQHESPNGPQSEHTSAHSDNSASDTSQMNPVFVAITPPPHERRGKFSARYKNTARVEHEGAERPDDSDNEDELETTATQVKHMTQDTQLSVAACELPARVDRSQSCGPETPTIVVNWNPSSQIVENQLGKQRMMATSEQTLRSTSQVNTSNDGAELRDEAPQSAEGQCKSGENAGAGSLGSGLSLFPIAANQVRKQSIMFFNTITARGTETLRRLSMVAHHPVDSLLRRSKSHDSEEEDRQQKLPERKRVYQHKRTFDDYLMAVAGIDSSSDEELEFAGEEQEEGGEEEEEEENDDFERMNLTTLLQREKINLPCLNVIEPSDDAQSSIILELADESDTKLAETRPEASIKAEQLPSGDTLEADKAGLVEHSDPKLTSITIQPNVDISGSPIKRSVVVSDTDKGVVSIVGGASKSLSNGLLAEHQQLKRAVRNPTSGRRRGAKRASRWHAKRLRAETKAAKTVAIIVGGFIFCWLPFFTAYLSRAIICKTPDCIPQSLLSLFIWLGYLNSAINPVIYGLFSADFRSAFKNILCRCRFRSSAEDSPVVSVLVDNIIKSIL